jgi:replicative DNA helicase
MYNCKYFLEVQEILVPGDFYLPAHKNIFDAMIECETKQLPQDEEFIKKILLSKNQFDEDAILEILSTSPLPSVDAYVKEIKEKSILRELHSFSGEVNLAVMTHDKSVEEIIDLSEQKLYSISLNQNDKDFSSPEETKCDTLAFIKDMQERQKNGLVGINTGFKELNDKTTGFNDGDFVVIAARPSMGKTGLVINMINTALKDGHGAAMFSLEMPKEQIMLRLLSVRCSIPLQKLRIGDLSTQEWERVNDALSAITSSSLFINDDGNITLASLKSKMRKLKSKHPEVKMCVIDYLQLMNSTKSQDRHLQISEISRGLKLLARELKMPVIALSQLNRSLEARNDKRPMLSDLRESGAIEQDADIVMFVYRDDVYKLKEAREKLKEANKSDLAFEMPKEKAIEEAEIIIAKNRNGALTKVVADFHKGTVQFKERLTGVYGAPVTIVEYKEDNTFNKIIGNDTIIEMPEV